MGRDGLSPTDVVDVSRLRTWINAMPPQAGLRPEVTDLIICAWAVLHTRAWYRYGGPVVPAPTPGALAPEMELRPERLPAAGDWEAAVERAAALFRTVANPYLTGQAVTELTQSVGERAGQLKTAAGELVSSLQAVYQRFGMDTGVATGRLATARSALALLAALTGARDRVALVEVLARYDLSSTPQATARSLESAATLTAALGQYQWDRLRPVQEAAKGTDERAVTAAGIIDRLGAALAADELAQPLQPALKRAEDEAFKWALGKTTNGGGGQEGRKPRPGHPKGGRQVASRQDLDAAVAELRAFAGELAGRRFTVEWRADE
jgi:hypothetical protein